MTERQIGPEGLQGPIPWSACQLYIRVNGIARDVGHALWEVLWRMDIADRDCDAEEMKARAGG